MYASARRKLIKATGIDPGRKPYSRSTAPVSFGAVTGITDAGPATSDADADPAAPIPLPLPTRARPPRSHARSDAPFTRGSARLAKWMRTMRTARLTRTLGAGTAVAEA